MDRHSVPSVSPQMELWLSAKTQSSHGDEVTIHWWHLAYKETSPKNSKACKQPSNSKNVEDNGQAFSSQRLLSPHKWNYG